VPNFLFFIYFNRSITLFFKDLQFLKDFYNILAEVPGVACVIKKSDLKKTDFLV